MRAFATLGIPTLAAALASAACAPGEVSCGERVCFAPVTPLPPYEPPPTGAPPRHMMFGPFDVEASGGDVGFDLPEGVAGFTVTVVGLAPVHVGFFEVAAPDGTRLYEIGGAADLNPTPDPYPGAASIMIPDTDDARAAPQAGTYRVRVGTFETDDDVSFSPMPGTVAAVHVVTELEEERGGTLDLHLAFTSGVGIEPASADADPFVVGMLAEVRALYVDAAGFALGSVTFASLPAEYDVISTSDAIRRACRDHAEAGEHERSINVFVVSNITFTGGYAGGVPGPPGLTGTPASCVVVEQQSTARATGVLMAHELGHFLGLFHTTHIYYAEGAYVRGGYDPVSDTPECPGGTLSSCPDYQNLMFPVFPTSGLSLSPAQIDVVSRSPWLYEP